MPRAGASNSRFCLRQLPRSAMRLEVIAKIRLFRQLKSSLIILLLGVVLAVPSVAQAAMGACQHSEQIEMVSKTQSSSEDCHDSADMADAGKQDSDELPKTKAPCCGTGMSCAPALALLANAVVPQTYAVRSLPVIAPAATYTSHISVPDYPPPRA
jgi:hypothetical protein